ncbi:MAG: hypothetical protein CMJ83_03155 [Planctomycetes bacterium]|nr:hypothetical protein [Planctomycetota bacterium]
MSKGVLAIGLCIFVVLAIFPAGCRDEGAPAFRAEALTAGAGPVGLNDHLRVRFSRTLAADLVPTEAVLVRDDAGHPIPVVLTRDGCHLLITPESETPPALWPESTSSLEVVLPVPVAGPGLKSADGQELAHGFRARVALRHEWTQRPGRLELEKWEPDNEKKIDLSKGLPFEIRLDFNSPIDVRSCETGVQIIDLGRKERVHATTSVDEKDPTVVVVEPFRVKGSQVFNADTKYEVRVTRHLRSRDGRHALEETLRFETGKLGPRLLQVNFDQQSDFDAETSRLGFDSTTGFLRPKATPGVVDSISDGRTELEGLEKLVGDLMGQETDPDLVPHVLSREPSRTQILFPGEWLGHDPRLIWGLSFLIVRKVEVGTWADDLAVTIGELNPELPPVTEGLSQEYDLNLVNGRLMDLAVEDDGRYVFNAHLKEHERKFTGPMSIVRLRFRSPYVYGGGFKNLVIDIRNASGVDDRHRRNLTPREGVIDVMGFKTLKWGRVLLTGKAGHPRATYPAFHFLPSMAIEVQDRRPVITRWYVVDDVRKPRFLSNPYVQTESVRVRDYNFEYQAGRFVDDGDDMPLLGPNGEPMIEPEGRWSAYPPKDGHPAVRLRISFTSRWYAPGEPVPEIEYILLRYKGS